jgi:hypothetical protein
VSPFTTAPGMRANASQIESVRPSSCAAPSIWYAAVAAPNTNAGGKLRAPGAESADVRATAGAPVAVSAPGVVSWVIPSLLLP